MDVKYAWVVKNVSFTTVIFSIQTMKDPEVSASGSSVECGGRSEEVLV